MTAVHHVSSHCSFTSNYKIKVVKNLASIILLSMLPLCLVACDWYPTEEEWGAYVKEVIESEVDLSKVDSTYTSGEKAAAHAYKQTVQNTLYDGSWVNIGYPGGDPGYQQGVCTDVVIRALRFIDIDLQELIHKDITFFENTATQQGLPP